MLTLPPSIPIVVVVPGGGVGGTYDVYNTPAGAIVTGPAGDPQTFQQGATMAAQAADPGVPLNWSGTIKLADGSMAGQFVNPLAHPSVPAPQAPMLAQPQSEAPTGGASTNLPPALGANQPAPAISEPAFTAPSWMAIVPVDIQGSAYTLANADEWEHQWIPTTNAVKTSLIAAEPDNLDAEKFSGDALANPSGSDAATAALSMMQHIGAPALAVVAWNKGSGNLIVSVWYRPSQAEQPTQPSTPPAPPLGQTPNSTNGTNFKSDGLVIGGPPPEPSQPAPPTPAPPPPSFQTGTASAVSIQNAYSMAVSLIGSDLNTEFNSGGS